MKEKRRLNYFLSLVMIVALFTMCDSRTDQVSEGSNLNTTPAKKNALDEWIDKNFTQPYNIDVVYRWDNALHNLGRYLYPPTIDSVKPALKLIKQVWIEPYSQVGGEDFIKKVAPRQLVLVGGKNKSDTGISTLGLAEAGKRVLLFEVDLLDKTSISALNQFMNTLQHEYGHILDQTKPFDKVTYRTISPDGYTAQWFNTNLLGSNNLGFITSYSRKNVNEDFAEMVAQILTRNKKSWNRMISGFKNDLGKNKVKEKEQIVANYYKEQFNIDLYALQDAVYKATEKYLAKTKGTN